MERDRRYAIFTLKDWVRHRLWIGGSLCEFEHGVIHAYSESPVLIVSTCVRQTTSLDDVVKKLQLKTGNATLDRFLFYGPIADANMRWMRQLSDSQKKNVHSLVT